MLDDFFSNPGEDSDRIMSWQMELVSTILTFVGGLAVTYFLVLYADTQIFG